MKNCCAGPSTRRASMRRGGRATRRRSPTLLYVGPRVDGSRDFSVPRLKSDGYATVNLAASYDIAKNLTAYARINNLLDRHYQDPVGFLHQGFGIFFGVRVGFDALASQG